MEIIKHDFLSNLKQIVEIKAKYQKVMLVYDDLASSVQISDIYEKIKDICIFNKMHTQKFDLTELNDGYKLIIFLLSADSYLRLGMTPNEFVNIFIPLSENVLPFYVDENYNLIKKNDYILLNSNLADICIETSVLFNELFEYFNNLILGKTNKIVFDGAKEITQNSLFSLLTTENLFFLDLKIIKTYNIPLSKLPLVDFMLISALKVMIEGVLGNNLTLVDCYKAFKDDEKLIEKFYALTLNNIFIEIIKLNKLTIKNTLNKIDEHIGNIIWSFDVSEKEFEDILFKLKSFLKNTNCYLSNLYLYNIFGV